MQERYIRIGLFTYIKSSYLPNLLRNITIIFYYVSLILFLYFSYLSAMTENDVKYFLLSNIIFYFIILGDKIPSYIIKGIYILLFEIYLTYIAKNKINGKTIGYDENLFFICKLNNSYKKYDPKLYKISSKVRLFLFILFAVICVFYIYFYMPLTKFIYITYLPIFISSFASKDEYYRVINDIFGI